jgi:phenylacetate-coenzyme A ligase PaaK-like adenylate-forming protein
LKQYVKNIDLEQSIFAAQPNNFNELALAVFNFQYQNNEIYQQFCQTLKVKPQAVRNITQIPFLPISFFKTHAVTSTKFTPQLIFESSGTTGSINSKHLVKQPQLYTNSFLKTFKRFYGQPGNKCILGLLPSYLQRGNSSLVYMVNELIQQSSFKHSGFYLDEFEKLHNTILHNEILQQPTLLIGVTYALLDFAEQFPMQLRNTIVMETGGMKGRREELTRQQVHNNLQQQLGVSLIHSEYGMTELLSQAYSKGDGIFHCPAWMKILLREEDDPFAIIDETQVPHKKNGVINVIDLANLYSCSFIATDDAGTLYNGGSFEVLGRVDSSDVRGCSLMAV